MGRRKSDLVLYYCLQNPMDGSPRYKHSLKETVSSLVAIENFTNIVNFCNFDSLVIFYDAFFEKTLNYRLDSIAVRRIISLLIH